ncbi:MAG: polysaccharide biosynthesis C-terminal domain-containing protein [Bacteroidota bacterium]|nr:polysaccharide biosynthesis C-terminal domain-containing protein [Bacteroidota bacterium]
MADLAIIVIFNNILGGNSIVYFMNKVGLSRLILPALIWIILSTTIISFVFSILHTQQSYFILLPITLITSFLSLNLLIFIGKEKIQLFNIFSLLPPFLLLIFNLGFIYLFKNRTVNGYLFCYFLSQAVVFVISLIIIKPYLIKHEIGISKGLVIKAFSYGWKNELSSFIQFLNYRLSYFFILYYQDITSVGLFSVAIVVSESIWLIAKSITTVQYSKIVNLDNPNGAIELTKKSAKLSLYATLFMLIVLALIPSWVFGFVFGKDFSTIKQLLFLLMPGILSIAVSNVYGHYFAALNQMRVLIIKSTIGLVFTVLLSIILIPLWSLNGACIVTSVSYLSSSIYLLIAFYKTSKNIPDLEITGLPDPEYLNYPDNLSK